MLLTCKEAGRRLGISAIMVHVLVEAGLLAARKADAGYDVIPEEELRKVKPLTKDEILSIFRQRTSQAATRSEGNENGRGDTTN